MRSITSAVLAALLLGTTATATFAAGSPANDDMSNATTIASLPFGATVDMSGATQELGENADCLFPSTRSVWYRYVVPQKQMLQVDLGGSDPDAGVRIYFEFAGSQPNLGYCVSMQYSGLKLMVEPVTTLWFQLTVDTGTTAALSITTVPLLTVSSTLDPTASYDAKAGTITATGTITCNLEGTGGVFVTIRQRQGRTVLVSQGSAEAACGPTPTRWTAILQAGVKAGTATADWSTHAAVFGPPDQFANSAGGPVTVSIKKR